MVKCVISLSLSLSLSSGWVVNKRGLASPTQVAPLYVRTLLRTRIVPSGDVICDIIYCNK